jgi:hypothetical protein
VPQSSKQDIPGRLAHIQANLEAIQSHCTLEGNPGHLAKLYSLCSRGSQRSLVENAAWTDSSDAVIRSGSAIHAHSLQDQKLSQVVRLTNNLLVLNYYAEAK